MAIESLGIGSGVLTTDLVDKIISAEREATDLRLTNKMTLVEARITAYGEIQSQLSKISSAVSKLASPSLANATVATSSDESILTATTSTLADPGTYSVEVLNTAKAHSLATSSYSSFDEIIGTGKLVFTFGENSYDTAGNLTGQTLNTSRTGATITIDSSNRTLSGIRDAINKADMGVTASIINDGNGYRLLMTSDDTGKESAMRIQALDSSGNLLTDGLAALAFNPAQNSYTDMEQTSAGQDALLRVNGLNISRASNAVDEVIKGVTLNLKNADVGTSVTITVAPDTEQLQTNIQDFVTAYNDFKSFTDDLSKYDSANEQAGLLLGDSTVRSIQYQIRSMLSTPITGLTGSKYSSLTELGVSTDQYNDYLLTFDTTKFAAALTADRNAVASILAKSGSATDSQVTYVNDSINTKPGTYDLVITQLATQARYDGGSVGSLDFNSPVEIDESNDNFTINVNGKNAAVSLTRGSYSSGDELAREIALQINSNTTLSRNGYSVSVDYDSDAHSFNITSNKYGSESMVYFTSLDTNTANTLGFNKLGAGTYDGVALTTLNSDAFNGRGSRTLAGDRPVDEATGINFSTANATFSLAVNGGAAVAITVNQNASGKDLNADGVYGDRKDTLQAIQTAIDGSSLNGQVTASFDDNGYLRFTTIATGSSSSINITAVGSSASDLLLGLNASDGLQANGKDAGMSLSDPVSFRVQVDDIAGDSLVSVPAGTYHSGADLASALQAAIQSSVNADANLSSLISGAVSETGSRDISTTIDFSSAASGFRLNVSGVEQDVLINNSTGDNLADIQTALDSTFGAGVVTASLDGTGLQLSTVADGREQSLKVVSDGRGARSSSFANLDTGIDFSADPATFTLTVGGIDMAVAVNGNATEGGNNRDSNLAAIQEALDDALVNSGEFEAGDVLAKVDDSGNLYFETVSKNGVRTASTYGSGASIAISNLGGGASTLLGMAADTSTNGYDGFGLDTEKRVFGTDLDVTVDYIYDADKNLGSFNINIGGQARTIGFTDLDSTAISFFGLQDVSLYSAEIPTGQDVKGTINGVEAQGTGQFLKAVDGNVAATNGYYIANTTADFSSPVVLDDTNNRFSIKIDGVEAEIELTQPATYISGTALASALQTAINGNSAFKSEGISVKVEFTTDATSFAYNKLGIISASTGADSSVEITDISTEASSIFGFVKGIAEGERGSDAVGQVDDASGLRLKITGGDVGSRGTISYISGFADQLSDILDGILSGQNSVINTKLASLDKEKTSVETEQTRVDARISAQEARLKSQFAYNDLLVQSLNSTLDYIKAQFDALNASNSNN
ncbi:flagellar filament capping protein FliD [Parathalassolituus penaei]|uniref:Filament cap protein n=1 Tax=Parathalassolituus penaei TaxID=2997323 RepID=A0A9X3IU71_9GAMM|nr:flagellar filament capping protein FliD [Parathalassolituus penaei]MCY0967070.1 flagellar filament capping protein FliD [Parathalassolituus penaei]